MSKIALTPNASGTGTFTIASPNSNTDRTLTLPDAAGTVLVDDGSGNVAVTGDLTIADKIVHTGDTDTALRFPAADTVTVETAGSERMRIDSSGKIGAGGTATNGRLTVKDSGVNPYANLNNAAITVYGSFGGGIALLDTVDPNSGSGYVIWVEDSANDLSIAQAATGTGASGGVYINNGAGSWASRSDERDKANLEPITDAAAKVQSLRAVTGEYIWAEGARHPFLIAQDVQAVLPEAVSVANKSAPEEDQRLGLSYTDVIPLLTAALQEALTKIEALEARVAALEGASA